MDYENALKHIKTRIGITILSAVADDDIQKGISFIKKETNCDDITAKALWCDLKQDFGQPENNPILQAREKYEQEKLIQDYQYSNNAECPYCHSKNTKKISGLSKAGSVALWGVFAVGKVSKQWHCNNCNSDF